MEKERLTMCDGQPITKGNSVRLNCTCHTDQEGIVRGFQHTDLAVIELESGANVCLPISLLTVI